MIPGVDVSSFQGPPADWRTVAGSISWAGVKMTQLSPGGPYRNPDASADWAALKSLGKGRVGYLFGHPGMSISATADLFLAELDACGLEDGDGVALDLEVTNGLSAAAVASWAADVLALLERDLDRLPLLYTFLSFAEAGNCAGLGKYALWIADPSSPRGHPRVPAPWKTWALHQFSSAGGIDRDVASFADLAAMRKALGKAVPVAKVADYKTSGRESLEAVAAAHKCAPSHILRLTAIRDGRYAAGLADYVNGVFAGTLPPSSPLPKGLVLRVPA
jgi:lysozyme